MENKRPDHFSPTSELSEIPSGSFAATAPGSSINLFSGFTLLWKDVEQFVNKGLFPAAISTFQLCLKYNIPIAGKNLKSRN